LWSAALDPRRHLAVATAHAILHLDEPIPDGRRTPVRAARVRGCRGL